ncbi:DnaJ C-terminal domain-containing protein [Radicibacter daui]|uniref:DnaJ C-terminal domain-containing protein n=1 Tax=Radicibacter daui TaxID=3064829 RepID=UPI004046D7A3
MRDPYQLLGVSRDASADDIKKAYRKLAKQYHPDLNPGDSVVEQRFKEVTAAYDLLSDADKRARFDRGEIDASGQERGFRSSSRRRNNTSAGASEGFGGFSAEDIFKDLFGDEDGPFGGAARGAGAGAGGRRGPTSRGADVAYSITVSFIEAARGAKRRLELTTGRTIEVSIQPGTTDGQKLRLKGQGTSGFGGGGAGDAIVEVHVEPHAFFERRGNDIHVTVPVTLQEAVLGNSIEVPTIDGKVSLRIPRGSNTGTKLRLKGKGVEDATSHQRGDQYVSLTVVLPQTVDDELAQFVEKWAKDHEYDVRKKAGMG